MIRTVSKVLCRTAQFTLAARDGAAAAAGGTDGDGLTLEGYAAVFGVPTRINSWEGTFDETIRSGAFKKTLREQTPVMQLDHGNHPLIGSIPIGTYSSLSEDETGLAVAGRLSDNWLMQPVRDAIASGAINGMSFRFTVVRDAWTDTAGKRMDPADDDFWEALWMGEGWPTGPLQRELIEVKMPEAGPVVFPAYRETSVSVRAQQLAGAVMASGDLMQEVRSELALGRPEPGVTLDLPGDDVLRQEIARAVLFGTAPGTRKIAPPARPARSGAPVESGHPADPGDVDLEDDEEPADDAPPTGAPAADDAPPERNDAPAVSHPSLTPAEARLARTRKDYVTRMRVGK
jgi:uncharacterized protein